MFNRGLEARATLIGLIFDLRVNVPQGVSTLRYLTALLLYIPRRNLFQWLGRQFSGEVLLRSRKSPHGLDNQATMRG